MQSLPPLISDLALILIVAGAVTLLFKRLRQPLALGYIVAGFLAGPHMAFLPTVQDHHSIETWSNIGVVFIMFTIGLEFSIRKIAKMGFRPILSACRLTLCMMGIGFGMGHLFGWNSTDTHFLGGMIAISSSAIIYKSFEDLGLMSKKFASEVLSVAVFHDILGIILMVVLSATAVSSGFQGGELMWRMTSLGFFLIFWFVVGIFLIPHLLHKSRSLMSRETLLIVSLGLCFLMVVLADKAGFSSAFGAFMMGSILAETLEAETIEKVVAPVKDLFGAIFFVAVGMLVEPQVLADYWHIILALVAAILLGQATLGTASFLLSGHPLRMAMRCSFSLAQIGEFSFIIAAMGVSLGVMSKELYPIIVAVSIITTFATPYMMRAADPTFALIDRLIPHRFKLLATQQRQQWSQRHQLPSQDWLLLLQALLFQVLVFGVLVAATFTLSLKALLPLLRSALTHWVGNTVTGLIALVIGSVFLRAIVMRKNNTLAAQRLHQSLTGRLYLYALFALRYALGTYALFYLLEYLSPLRWPLHLLLAAVLLALICRSRWVKYHSIRLERRFVENLRQRETEAERQDGSYAVAGKLAARDLHFARITLPTTTLWGGRSLMELDFAQRDGVIVAAILRGGLRFNSPAGYSRLYPGDVLEVIGDDQSLEGFRQRSLSELHPYNSDGRDHRLHLRRFVVAPHSPLAGKIIAESGIREQWACTLVGFEDERGSLTLPTARQVISPRSVLWFSGEEAQLAALHAVLQPPHKTSTEEKDEKTP